MRAKADEFEAIGVRLAVDKDKIRPDVAIAMIAPLAGQWMIKITARQWRVAGEEVNDLHQEGVEPPAVRT